jgi:hypothetical protein
MLVATVVCPLVKGQVVVMDTQDATVVAIQEPQTRKVYAGS